MYIEKSTGSSRRSKTVQRKVRKRKRQKRTVEDNWEKAEEIPK